jgi:hypothetical protein
VVAKNSAGATSSGTWSFTTITSQPAPGTPGNLSPANGATGISVTTALTWAAASNATSYDVYFGTSASPALAGNTTGTSYSPGTLSANTTYYWRVAAKNSAGATSSTICSFTTTSSNQAPAPVSVTPSSGSGLAQTFSFTSSAPNGLANANVLINASASGQYACWFNYNPSTKLLSLASDDTSSWAYSSIGSGATLQNSQCSLLVSGASVVTSGSNTTLIVPVTFKTVFRGSKGIYLRVQDLAGTMTGFVLKGTWSVPRR